MLFLLKPRRIIGGLVALVLVLSLGILGVRLYRSHAANAIPGLDKIKQEQLTALRTDLAAIKLDNQAVGDGVKRLTDVKGQAKAALKGQTDVGALTKRIWEASLDCTTRLPRYGSQMKLLALTKAALAKAKLEWPISCTAIPGNIPAPAGVTAKQP